jgi:hypothetical protein
MPQRSFDTAPADPLKLHPEDLPDIQGFIVHEYNMPKSRHFVLTVGQVGAALDFLDTLTSGSGALSVTSAKTMARRREAGVCAQYRTDCARARSAQAPGEREH